MKRRAKGEVRERITALLSSRYPVYLVQGDEKSMLMDAGVNLLAPSYLASIKDTFGDAGFIDYLFVTHSHYDHIGSVNYMKRHIPDLRVGAHERVDALLRKPSALERMNRLSMNHVELKKYNLAGGDPTIHPFDIDIHLKHGDKIDLGGLTCRVYETPGHTQDSLSFYFPEIKTLFPGEACGVLWGETGGRIQAEFLSSYQDYIESLTFLQSLEPETVCLAHGWVLTSEEVTEFLQDSLSETFRYRKLIENYLDAAHGDIEEATRNMAHVEYDVKGGIFQERIAYTTNLNAQIKLIAAAISARPPGREPA
jgi:glyoxylase-like metal-dependent hydrolase (beta-lactamase superfamily II)